MMFRIGSVSLYMLLVTATLTFSATVTYEEDPTSFANPERGYYIVTVSANALQAARKEGMTLVRKYYRLDSCLDVGVLPQSVLDGINKDAAILRQEGAKLIPRFAYNFGACTTPPVERVLRHIEQLTPVLRSNSDYLNLPDPASSIHNRPEYSIRLANKDVWEDSTGYNSLLHQVRISSSQ